MDLAEETGWSAPGPAHPCIGRVRIGLLAATVLLATGGSLAHAQSGGAQSGGGQSGGALGGKTPGLSRDQPVYYQADKAEYDRQSELVSLTGHVEIWQNDRILRADRVTFDRNTDTAAASGDVVLLEPDGQVLFSDYAELTQGLKEGVLRNIRAQLAQNGKLAANGGRRTTANVNELSRAIYSTCNVCAQHPDAPLFWDLRARSAVQDVENKRIEYRDAVVDIYGIPVAYLPYFTHPDPSQKRASGFLVPAIGNTSHLGPFVEVPYYWVIDGQSDATFTPIIAGNAGPVLQGQYRHRFNDGTMTIDASVGYDHKALQGDVFAKGQFAIDDTWRWGFDIQRASSETYMRDFRISGWHDVLTSQVYLEGFGQGSYSRLDSRAYQGLTSNIIAEQLPFVLPRWQYSFVGEPDSLGGRFGLDTSAFNVLRQQGTNTQRLATRLNWERPATGALGDLWKLVLHIDAAAYNTNQLDQQPSFGPAGSAESAQAMPTAALEMHWPLQRNAGSWGTQIIEPIAQLIAAPNGSAYATRLNANGTRSVNSLIPNEDSLDEFDWTDATLFALNRFPGVDRLEGGLRANVALHGAWYFPSGAIVDAQVGQGYRAKEDKAFPVGSGLRNTVTDVVSHVTFTPNQYFDITSRQRFSSHNLDVTFADAIASVGPSLFRLAGGYIYSNTNPYNYYLNAPTDVVPAIPRNEITLAASTNFGPWRFNAFGRRNLQDGTMVSAGFGGSYENECFIFAGTYARRYTSIDNDHGDTIVLFQITLKTVGQFGFNAL